ncbi:MAG: hypothetical protein KKA07_00315 [Bacteroidetes bacterium]|nr:hypothetical protein [Bacteroidota bacterium]MBU1717494.1 hypothetical protein [Bacteroidota bacterium]
MVKRLILGWRITRYVFPALAGILVFSCTKAPDIAPMEQQAKVFAKSATAISKITGFGMYVLSDTSVANSMIDFSGDLYLAEVVSTDTFGTGVLRVSIIDTNQVTGLSGLFTMTFSDFKADTGTYIQFIVQSVCYHDVCLNGKWALYTVSGDRGGQWLLQSSDIELRVTIAGMDYGFNADFRLRRDAGFQTAWPGLDDDEYSFDGNATCTFSDGTIAHFDVRDALTFSWDCTWLNRGTFSMVADGYDTQTAVAKDCSGKLSLEMMDSKVEVEM